MSGAIPAIDKRELGLLEELGSGNFGVVHRATVTLDGAPRRMAYKELKQADGKRRKAVDVRWGLLAIKDAVRFRDSLSPRERAHLDAFTVWPQALVTEGRYLRGYLMNEIEPAFFLQAKDGKKMAELSWLSAKENSYRKLGIDPGAFTVQIRLYLLTQLAYAISWLHRRGRIYGDLSLSNGIFSANPPRFLLIDCDATAVAGDATRRQANTPGFFPPESEFTSLQTTASDVYKLSLCIVRGLTHGRNATRTTSTEHLAGVLPPEVILLLRRGLSPNPDARPDAKEIWRALDALLRSRFPPPSIEGLTLEGARAVPRGQDVMVCWRCQHAGKVTITGPDGASYVSSGGRGRVAVRAGCSGEISIRITNPNGFTRAVVGEVSVFELPTFGLAAGSVPRPVVPRPPAVEGSRAPEIPRIPRAPGPPWRFDDIPAAALRPDLAALFRGAQRLIHGMGPDAARQDRGGGGAVAGFDDVMDTVRAAMRESMPTINEMYRRERQDVVPTSQLRERDGHEHGE